MRLGIRLAGITWGLALASAGCLAPSADDPSPAVALGGGSPLVAVFEQVAAETGVPAELLATLAHVETRLQLVTPATHHTHGPGALGLFGLSPEELARGARLAGVTDEAARTDVLASTRAGAALLRAHAPAAHTLNDFLASLAPGVRHEVSAALARGVDARDADGHAVTIAARGPTAIGFGVASQALAPLPDGYPDAEWIPASSANYQLASRGVGDIDHVVIHTTQGGYAGVISWFQNPSASVSAHYLLRSSDGHVAQMVDERHVAWHDKCFNTTTVGIEHEGYVEKPEIWYTEVMYAESARLTAYLADKYGIAKEKGPIIGHGEAPDCSTHTDPGPGWNWEHYIDLVRTGGSAQFAAGDVVVAAPGTIASGERATVTVTITNRGNATWDLDITRLGTAAPQDRASAFFVDGDWVAPNRATGVDALVRPGEAGTFTFEVVAPRVRAPTVFDETFQLVEEGVTWFGPDIHVVMQVVPEGDAGGCAAAKGGSGAMVCVMFALGAVLVSRRRRDRPERR